MDCEVKIYLHFPYKSELTEKVFFFSSLKYLNALHIGSIPLVDNLGDLLAHHLVLQAKLGLVDLVRMVVGTKGYVDFLLLGRVVHVLHAGLLGVLLVFGGKVLKQEVDELVQQHVLGLGQFLHLRLELLHDLSPRVLDLLLVNFVQLDPEVLVEILRLQEPGLQHVALGQGDVQHLPVAVPGLVLVEQQALLHQLSDGTRCEDIPE